MRLFTGRTEFPGANVQIRMDSVCAVQHMGDYVHVWIPGTSFSFTGSEGQRFMAVWNDFIKGSKK
jgi:hypothetical protein